MLILGEFGECFCYEQAKLKAGDISVVLYVFQEKYVDWRNLEQNARVLHLIW